MSRSRATCMVCGLTAGNSANVPVYAYTLLRSVFVGRGGAGVSKSGTRTRSFGSIGLCDRCRREARIERTLRNRQRIAEVLAS